MEESVLESHLLILRHSLHNTLQDSHHLAYFLVTQHCFLNSTVPWEDHTVIPVDFWELQPLLQLCWLPVPCHTWDDPMAMELVGHQCHRLTMMTSKMIQL
jgi:hypothetical protein